jgi:hypothetical protein
MDIWGGSFFQNCGRSARASQISEKKERKKRAHSSRVVGRLCGWEAVAECSDGRSEGIGEGLGRFGGICELRAVAGRGGALGARHFHCFPSDSSGVAGAARREWGAVRVCSLGAWWWAGPLWGIVAVVAVAGRGGEDCFSLVTFPADSLGVAGTARRERFQSAPSAWWSWRGSRPLYSRHLLSNNISKIMDDARP